MNMTNKLISRCIISAGLGIAAIFPLSLTAQEVFATPEEASVALVKAVQANDEPAKAKILGANWKEVIPNDVNKEDVDAFLAQYNESHRVQTEGNTARLAVGPNDWTLPIPIVKGATGWAFDLKAGREEIITRQVGTNEIEAVQSILAYYDAQRDYATEDHNHDGIREYAQKFLSTAGKHDGLYWPAKDGEPESPLGPAFAGDTPVAGQAYHGYRFRILTEQGPSAPGGAYKYIVGGRMRNGFAAIAWPAHYGETGIMSFMISHDGEVFEKDLGKDSTKIATAMKSFDPDDSWHEVE
jgi:hypothetical protein